MDKFSFSTAALFPRTAAESLRLIAGAGFSHAELMPQCFAEADERFASQAEKCGIHVASIHYPLAMFSMLYNAGDSMVGEARRFGDGLVRLCRALDAKVLVVHPHEPAKDPARAALLEAPIVRNLKALGEACAAAGVTLAIENSPKGPGRTPAGLLAYVEALGASPTSAPMVDTTEACEADEDPVAFIAAVRPCHTHLSDHAGRAEAHSRRRGRDRLARRARRPARLRLFGATTRWSRCTGTIWTRPRPRSRRLTPLFPA